MVSSFPSLFFFGCLSRSQPRIVVETNRKRTQNEVVPKQVERMETERAMNAVGEVGIGEIDVKKCTIEEALAHYKVDHLEGLSEADALDRLNKYGPNSLPEIKQNHCLKFLSFMWNPLSWVMEAAALVAILLSNGPTPWLCNPPVSPCTTTATEPDWEDFVGIVCLLILNSVIGYFEEEQAGKVRDVM